MHITTADGRTVAYELTGPSDGSPIIAIHGTPGSRLGRFPIGDPYAAAGVRVLTFDRPGYGESARLPGRAVSDCIADVTALADHMDWDRFAVMGGSGGGPHALACAALLPDRVTRVICNVGIAPYPAEGLDFFDGMVEGNVVEFRTALRGEAAVRELLDAEAKGLKERLGGDLRDLFGEDYPMSEADLDVMANGAVAVQVRRSMTEALRPGVDGWVDDNLAFVKPWGFDIKTISVPVRVGYGEADTLVPAAHGRWLAAHVPGAIEVVETDGHLGDIDPEKAAARFRWLAGTD